TTYWSRAMAIAVRFLALGMLTATAMAADGPPQATKPTDPSKGPPNAVVILEKVWPGHPESVAMLVDILQGSRLGPTDGWFRKAVSKTRFDAMAMLARYDKDDDERISP